MAFPEKSLTDPEIAREPAVTTCAVIGLLLAFAKVATGSCVKTLTFGVAALSWALKK